MGAFAEKKQQKSHSPAPPRAEDSNSPQQSQQSKPHNSIWSRLATSVSGHFDSIHKLRQKFERRYSRYSDRRLMQKITKLRLMMILRPMDVEKRIELDVATSEQQKRRDVRRAMPIRVPHTTQEAIELLKEAEQEETIYDDRVRSAQLVNAVWDWIRPITKPDVMQRHFGRLSFTDHARFFPGEARSRVKHLVTRFKLGSTIGGHWQYTIGTVRAASEHLSVLNQETAIKNTSIPKTHGALTDGTKLTVGIFAAALAAPAVVKLAIAEGSLMLYASQTAGRTVWVWAGSNPYAATAVAEFAASTGIDIIDSGGLNEFAQQLKTPQGALMKFFEILTLKQALGGSKHQTASIPDLDTTSMSKTPISNKGGSAKVLPEADLPVAKSHTAHASVEDGNFQLLSKQSQTAPNVEYRRSGGALNTSNNTNNIPNSNKGGRGFKNDPNFKDELLKPRESHRGIGNGDLGSELEGFQDMQIRYGPMERYEQPLKVGKKVIDANTTTLEKSRAKSAKGGFTVELFGSRAKMHRGNLADDVHGAKYQQSEVSVETRIPGKSVRIDNIDFTPSGYEFISRKNPSVPIAKMNHHDAIDHIQEFVTKYPPKIRIRGKKVNGVLVRGPVIQGKRVLEIPPQSEPIPKAYLEYATSHGITVRDYNGKVYN